MLSNKSMGIAGVAMLGTVAILGTNAANAALDLDAAGTMASPTNALVYAKETLTDKFKGTEDANEDMDYYTLEDAGNFHTVTFEAGIVSVLDETTILVITLEGLVFDADTPAEPGGWTRRTGGARGETSATFSTTSAMAETAVINLAAKFAISAAGRGLDRGDAD